MSANEIRAHHLTGAQARSKNEWSSLVEMIPSTLDLISARSLAHQGLELISNAANKRCFISVLTKTQADLRDAGVPVLVKEHRGERQVVAPSDLTRPQRRWLGQLSLELYFTQLFRSDAAVVDLWPSRLGVDVGGDAVWYPRPLYLQWDPEFLQALRDVYAGFFLGNDACFRNGIGQLGLDSSGALLLQHLGEGDQRGVRFSATKLQSTLLEMSANRSTQDGSLHRNFIAFGLYVVSLHELLESLGLAFDVRSAFMRSYHAG